MFGDSLDKALEICDEDTNCQAIHDAGCNKAPDYNTCWENTTFTSSAGSCIYEKGHKHS